MAYINVGKNEIFLYPDGGASIFSRTNMLDAMLHDGKWYYNINGSGWKYEPLGEEMDFPQYESHAISKINGAMVVDGSMMFGTNYGVLKASYVKQQVVEEDEETMPLEKNFTWGSSIFKTLN